MALYSTSVESFPQRQVLLWAAFLGLAPITMMMGIKLQTPIRKFVRYLNQHAKSIVDSVRQTTRNMLTSSSSTKKDDKRDELLEGTRSLEFEVESPAAVATKVVDTEARTKESSDVIGEDAHSPNSASRPFVVVPLDGPSNDERTPNLEQTPATISGEQTEETEEKAKQKTVAALGGESTDAAEQAVASRSLAIGDEQLFDPSARPVVVPATAAGDSNTPTPDPSATPLAVVPPPFMLAHMPTKEYGLQLFDELDTNHNQMLSFAELGTIWNKLFGNLTHKTPRMRAYLAADQNSDGCLKRDEYEVFLRYTVYYNNCWDAFHGDGGGSGNETTKHAKKVSRQEFLAIAPTLLGSQVGGKHDPNELFDVMDANHSHQLSYDEFCRWMARNTCEWGDSNEMTVDDASQRSKSRGLSLIVGNDDDAALSSIQAPQGEEGKRSRSTSATSAASTIASGSGKGGSGRVLMKPSTVPAKKIIHVPDSMVKHLPPKEFAMKLFDKLDRDKNGMLSFAELGKIWKKLFLNLKHKASVMKAYKAADENADGFLKRDEFEAFLRYSVYYNNCWDVFVIGNRRKKQHATFMNQQEFVKISASLGIVDGEDPNRIFEMMDSNHSRAVTYDEYCTWMARHTCEWDL